MALSDLFHAVVQELTVSQDRKNELHEMVDEHFQAADAPAEKSPEPAAEKATDQPEAVVITPSTAAVQPGLIYQKDS